MKGNPCTACASKYDGVLKSPDKATQAHSLLPNACVAVHCCILLNMEYALVKYYIVCLGALQLSAIHT